MNGEQELDPNWRFRWDRPVVPHPLWLERARRARPAEQVIADGKAQAEREERAKAAAGAESVKLLTAGMQDWLRRATIKQVVRHRTRLLRVLSRRP